MLGRAGQTGRARVSEYRHGGLRLITRHKTQLKEEIDAISGSSVNPSSLALHEPGPFGLSIGRVVDGRDEERNRWRLRVQPEAGLAFRPRVVTGPVVIVGHTVNSGACRQVPGTRRRLITPVTNANEPPSPISVGKGPDAIAIHPSLGPLAVRSGSWAQNKSA
jgi:hypothetical protein